MGLGKKFKKGVSKVSNPVSSVINTVGDLNDKYNPVAVATNWTTDKLGIDTPSLGDYIKNPSGSLDQLKNGSSGSLGGSTNVSPTFLLTPEQQAYLNKMLGYSTDALPNLYSSLSSLAKSGTTYDSKDAGFATPYAANNYDTSRNAYQANNYNSKNSYAGDLNYDNQNSYAKADYNNQNTYAAMDYNNGNAYNAVGNWEDEFNSGVVNPAMSELSKQLANSKHSSNLHSSANRAAQDELRQNVMNNLSSQRYSNLMRQQQLKQQATENQYSRGLTAAQVNAQNQNAANESYQNRALNLSQANAQNQQSANEAYQSRLLEAARTNQAQKQSAYENQYSRDLTNLNNESALRQQANQNQNQLMYSTMQGNAANLQSSNDAYNAYLTNQQQLKQTAAENAYSRNLSALSALSGLSGQSLGNYTENIVSKNPGLLDYISAGANVANAGANVYGAYKKY